MHATASSSRSPSSTCAPPRRAAKIVAHTPPNCAYGFILDEECLRHWTKVYYDEAYGPEVLSSMNPKEADEEIDSVFAATADMIPTMVYKQFPRIPRPNLRRRLVLMSGANGRWLLVLKDNSSQAMLSTKIAPEDVEGVRKLLDLGEQKPMWYRIPSW
ncbi:hypothetical protein C8T65DRAFT_725521 [Cerioporus squamosus]|nr:hypothetical protein C8T65DRAFT_725521 [Cerioporus squamosus]